MLFLLTSAGGEDDDGASSSIKSATVGLILIKPQKLQSEMLITVNSEQTQRSETTEAETYFVLCVRKSARGSVGMLPDVMHCGIFFFFFSQHIVRRGFTATRSEAPNVLIVKRRTQDCPFYVCCRDVKTHTHTQKIALKSKFLFSAKEANANI